MMFFGVVLGIAIMGAMVYLALDKKSNFQTRIVALAALGLMILTVIICLVVVLTDTTVVVDESVVIVGAPMEVVHESEGNIVALLFSIIFLLGLFAVIAYIAMQENKKKKAKS